MTQQYDVIVIGGGPGGSVASTYLAMAGLKVAILDKQVFPRFQIGESLLPASMKIFKDIGFFDTINDGRYLQKFGAKFVDAQTDDEVYFDFSQALDEGLDMAFEVPRSEFDYDLQNHAKSKGVTVLTPTEVLDIREHPTHIDLTTDKGPFSARFVIDATGRKAFLGTHFKMRHANKNMNNAAVFTHYENVDLSLSVRTGDIIIGMFPNRAWSWMIPFKGNVTSVGIVVSTQDHQEAIKQDGFIESMIGRSKILSRCLKNAKRRNEVRTVANYSAGCESFHGNRWVMIGDAAMFLDPVFSSGVHVSITSGKAAAEMIIDCLRKNEVIRDGDRGRKYEEYVKKGVGRFHSIISLFYGEAFIRQTIKTGSLSNLRRGFTSAVAGDMWNDRNPLFQIGVL